MWLIVIIVGVLFGMGCFREGTGERWKAFFVVGGLGLVFAGALIIFVRVLDPDKSAHTPQPISLTFDERAAQAMEQHNKDYADAEAAKLQAYKAANDPDGYAREVEKIRKDAGTGAAGNQ